MYKYLESNANLMKVSVWLSQLMLPNRLMMMPSHRQWAVQSWVWNCPGFQQCQNSDCWILAMLEYNQRRDCSWWQWISLALWPFMSAVSSWPMLSCLALAGVQDAEAKVAAHAPPRRPDPSLGQFYPLSTSPNLFTISWCCWSVSQCPSLSPWRLGTN